MANNNIKVIEGVYPVTVDEAVYISGTNKKISDALDNYWMNKKAIILGDSFSDPSNSHPKWYNYLTSLLGIEILRNYSVGGYRMCPKKYEEDPNTGVADSYNHYDNISNYDYTGADVIIICTAINDFFSNSPIDTVKGAEVSIYTPEKDRPNPDTFTGSYELILSDIVGKACTSTQKIPLIVLCTPTNSHVKGTYKNEAGYTTEDYSKNIHDIAYAWGCAVCDWNKGSGWNAKTTYSNLSNILGVASDGCHPNEWGAERLGRMVANTIKMY